MLTMRRVLVPRKVAKVLHPVNIPSPATLLTPSIPKPRRKR